MRRSLIDYAFLLLFILSLSGCINAPSADEAAIAEKRREEEAQTAAAQPAPAEVARYSGPIQFVDVTGQAGINFKHTSGAAGKKYLPETMGAGCAFLDFDNDGWQDILLVNSTRWPGDGGQKSYPALYRNNRDGSFAD
ncbi:MAG TPA: VCBS repeat-containing protein, partial [Blastocatellia bacterium]|nr:VCBS repeat-containing protein [Blastocatellia bacterium]